MTKYTTMEFPRMVTMVKSEPRIANHMPGLLDAVQFQVYASVSRYIWSGWSTIFKWIKAQHEELYSKFTYIYIRRVT